MLARTTAPTASRRRRRTARGHRRRGKHAAQQQGGHREQAGRAQQPVGHQRSRDVDDHDQCDRPQPRGARCPCPLPQHRSIRAYGTRLRCGPMPGPQLTSFEHVLLGLICLSRASRLRPQAHVRGHAHGPLPAQFRRPLPRAAPPGSARPDPRHRPARRQRVTPAPPRLRADPGRPRNPPDLAANPGGTGFGRTGPGPAPDALRDDGARPRARGGAGLPGRPGARAGRAGRGPGALRRGPPPGGLHPGLALDHGLAVHRASLDWVQRAIAALREEPATTVGS